jgi:hypothetical protein
MLTSQIIELKRFIPETQENDASYASGFKQA